MGRSAVSTIVAVLFVVGSVRADGPWRSSGEAPPAKLPPPADPTPPPPAVPTADTPPWNATRTDGPRWVPARGAPTLPDSLPVVQAPVAPIQKPEVVPAPQPVAPKTGNGQPKTEAPPARLPEPRPNPLAAPPAALWGGPPAACPPELEPVPGALSGTVPHRHKTFGSPNLTLSRDYHCLDLIGLSLLGGEDANTVVLSEGPATDRFFFQAEYLLWWVNRGDVPVLATTAPEPANPADPNANFGFLGRPGTTALLGPGQFGSSARNGFRVRAGTWLDGCGLDGSFFFLGERTNTFEVASPLFPVLTRPFFAPNINPLTGQPIGEFGEVVAGGGTQGSLRVEQTSRLWGADLNFRHCINRTCVARSEWFAGYRHLNLREELRIDEFIVAGPNDAPLPAGTRISVHDEFRASNRFHGGQLGYAVGRRWGRIDADARVSLALGVTHQELDIAGFQQVQRPGQALPSVFNGGLLAAGPNLGNFTNDEFSVVPEFTFNVGYMLTPTVRAYVGYNFLYWTNVARPGEQIDRVVDLTFIPNAPAAPFSGQNRPLPLFRQSDFWAQGLQLGMELRW